MKVLICGAGVAGLTLAYWLAEDGHSPVVIEKARELRTEGYMIDFAGSGVDVAQRMHLDSELQEYDRDIERVVYHRRTGDVAATLGSKALFKAANVNGKFFTLDRSDLVRALYDTVTGRCEVRFGTTVDAIKQSAQEVTVTFDDGSRETYDLLVGADGIHSTVRHLAYGDEQQFARNLGYQFAIFYTSGLDRTLEKDFHMYVEPDRQVGVMPVGENRWMVMATYRSDEPVSHQNRLEVLKRHLDGMGWLVPELLTHVDTSTSIFMDRVTQIRMPVWSQNRVALIGDAAYCPTLISGQGASMAMAGAYLLAQALRQDQEVTRALAQYEAWLRPHIERTQSKAARFAPTFVPKDHLRIFLTHWAIRLISASIVSRFVGKQFSVESIFDLDQRLRFSQKVSA